MKPQDILVVLKLASLASGGRSWSYPLLSAELGLSASEAHAAVRRLLASGLLQEGVLPGAPPQVNVPGLQEFLVHGIGYVYPPDFGGQVRGMKTSFLPNLDIPPGERVSIALAPPLVWPYAEGQDFGLALKPLYPSVPVAATRDQRLYELLTLVDMLRCGQIREKQQATLALSGLLEPVKWWEAGAPAKQA